jgi:hypothetical protein
MTHKDPSDTHEMATFLLPLCPWTPPDAGRGWGPVDGCLSIQYRLQPPACTSAHASTTPLLKKKKEEGRTGQWTTPRWPILFSQSEQAWGKIYKKKERYILIYYKESILIPNLIAGGAGAMKPWGCLLFYLRSPDSTVPLPSANSCSLQLHQMMFALGFFVPCSRNPGWSLLSWCLVWSLVSWAVYKG